MRSWLTLIAICILSFGGTALLSRYLYNNETQQIEAEFQRDISRRAFQLDNELVKLRATMRYWRKFYEVSNAPIEPNQFRTIAKDVLKTYPSVQVIGWAPLISQAQRKSFEQQFRRINPHFSIFTIRPEMNTTHVDEKLIRSPRAFDPRLFFSPSAAQDNYFPVAVLEPKERAGFLTGLDMASVNSVSVSTYIAQVRHSGSSDIIGLPGLVSPFSPAHEPIIVALVPVYLGSTASPNQEPKLHGFIATIFSANDLVHDAVLSDQPKDVNFELRDITDDGGLKVLYRYGEAVQSRMTFQRPVIDVLGRQWLVVASPSDNYIATRRSMVPAFSFFGGFVFTGLLLLYANVTRRQTRVVKALVEERTQELKCANEKLEQLSRIDSLTGIANRRQFNEVLEREWKRAVRERTSIALLVIDVDFFKNFNDHYGHLRGDECLIMVARALGSGFQRSGDLVARYGGEEFAVILPNTGSEIAEVAERYREAVEKLLIEHGHSDVASHVTVSIGASAVVPVESMCSDDLVDCADKGLYAAKAQGRNRVVYQTCQVEGASIAYLNSYKAS